MKILIIDSNPDGVNQDGNLKTMAYKLNDKNHFIDIARKDCINLEEYNKYDRIINFDITPHKIDGILDNDSRVYNKPKYIKNCYNKYNTYTYLKDKFRQPKTYLNNKSDLQYPLVMKIKSGSLGIGIQVVKNELEEKAARDALIKQELIITNFRSHVDECIIYQEIINSSWGKDLRVVLIGGKYVACELRQNKSGKIQSNLAQGGTASIYPISKEQIELCEKIAQELKLDYVGIDMLFDENNNLILCEANQNAFYKGITETTGIDVCEKYIEYIMKERSIIKWKL